MRFVLVALLAGAPLMLQAQAPQITPSGDPSIRADTIYALARGDSARFADRPYTYLLDDGVVRIETDGRGSRTYRQIIHVLTREAAENWGELAFSYSPSRERLRVNWVRVVSLDGTVLADRPAHEQESLSPVAQESPVYTDAMVRRLSLGAVAPGVIVDYSYTTEITNPVMPGNFVSNWSITTGEPVHRSRLIVDVPKTMRPLLREENLRRPAAVTERGDRRTYAWIDSDVPRLEGEPFAASPNSIEVGVTVLAPLTWSDVGRWYAGLARGRYAVTPEVEARLPGVFAGAASREDSLRALHRWVAQDFRYVSLSLGIGGYRPRTPAEVVRDQYGDCKDKATLFIAVARRIGLRAWPVLLSAGGGARRDLPTPFQFDHMIAAVERPLPGGGRGGLLYLDLTAELTPFGALPPAEQGGFALLVRDDGKAEEVSLPQDSVSANRTTVVLHGELGDDGSFAGTLTRTATGASQYALREAFRRPITPVERDRLVRAIANEVFQGASGDSLIAFDGRDLTAVPRMTVSLRGGRPTSNSGGMEIFTLPLDNFASAGLVQELEARPPRRFPIDAAAVFGEHEIVSELRVTLPAGWRARLPQGVTATSVFGSYRAEYAQSGRVLTVRRSMTGARGIHPPARIAELIAWLRELSRDDVRFLVLEH
jgi:transglutaminase-like putative cysteine protease